MIRSKGEAGTGDIVEAVRHMRAIAGEIRRLDDARRGRAGERRQGARRAARISCASVAADGRLPVVLFCAGGIATPADAALMMALGAEGVFVGSGIFKSEDPPARARAIVEATTHWQDPERVAAASRGLGPAMISLESSKLEGEQLLAPVAAGRASVPLVGVLALQGGFEAHGRVLRGPGRATCARCARPRTSTVSTGW